MKETNYIRIWTLLFIFLTLASCEKEVDFQHKSEPKMILTSLLDCNSTTNVIKVSESVSLFSDTKPSKIEKPNLQIKVNGTVLEKPAFLKDKDEKVYYNFTSTLKSSDKIEIFSNTDKYGNVYGSDIVPKLAKIKNVDTEWFTNNEDEDFLRVYTTIEDIPNEKNYYRIIIKVKHTWDYMPESEWREKEVFIDQEPIFRDITESINLGGEDFSYKIFSDGIFSNRSYKLNVYIKDDKFDRPEDIKSNHKYFIQVEVHSISEAMYKYLKSVELALKQDSFQEPIKLYTNISGGYGVIGAYNKTFVIKAITR